MGIAFSKIFLVKMAVGKHGRQDKQASSSLCFKGTVIIFVGVCILAVWMMNSSSPVPAERQSFNGIRKVTPEIRVKPSDSSPGSQETKEKTKDSSSGVSFEDNPGDLPEDAIKGDDGEELEKIKNPQIQQKTQPDKASDDGAGNLNEENKEEDNSDGAGKSIGGKRSDGDENSNEEEKSDGDVKAKEKSDQNQYEGKDEDNVTVNDNEETTEKGDNETDSQEKKDIEEEKKEAENNSKPEKSGGSDSSENENNEGKSKTEGKPEKNGKQETTTEENTSDSKLPDVLPNGGQAELLKENTIEPGNWETQAAESKGEKGRQEAENLKDEKKESPQSQSQNAEDKSVKGHESSKQLEGQDKDSKKSKEKNKDQSNQVNGNSYNWQICNSTAGPDYIPCLDNFEAIQKLPSTKHYEHRERHCPKDPPTCLVPLPEGYRLPVHWPESRDKIWYNNVPHTKLAEYKKHQNWVRVSGEYNIFPGGGTQFKNGALHYIDFIEETIPDVAWGRRSRVVLDVGCGVASFGGFLFERQVLTMSLAPKDEHEAQVQFALERGIPAISAVMGTQRLPFPSTVFDVVHCARCRVPWHADGGKLLLELNRLLRPGGYFVWSATPVYQNKEEDVQIWKEMSSLTASICWNLLAKKGDEVNEVGVAIYQKPTSNHCYESRRKNEPPLCEEEGDLNAAWYVPMESCLQRVPHEDEERGNEWPEEWPSRLEKVPYWLKKDVHDSFISDTEHWKRVVSKSYLVGMGIDWSAVRNVMDMKAVYGGFAAALVSQPVWVMNVVPIDAPNTLPVIYERGLFGIYHDWCESFSTYPRTYDLLHADHLFSKLKKRCSLVSVMAEVDRILRPGGSIIFRDTVETLNELENMIKSLQWQIRMTYSQDKEGILCAQKTMWRPQQVA